MATRFTCTDCGYAKAYRTQAVAEYGFARHSCDKELARQEMARRVRIRQANRDGIRRDCDHPIARHQHGTRQAYCLDKCRCAPCKDAARVYEANRVRQRLYGRWDHRTDAEPVREHIRTLMAQGTGYKQLARIAGVPLTTLSQVLYGRPDRRDHRPPRTCATDFAAKVLAVQVNPWQLSDGARVDAAGTCRRVQALVALGWSQQVIANRIHVTRSNFRILTQPTVTVGTAKAVRDVYQELWDTAPPETNQRERISATRSKRFAAARGWLPPLAWDDDTMDDPAALPMLEERAEDLDEIAVERIMAGTLRVPLHSQSPERREAIRRLAAHGYTDRQIGERLGLSTAGVGYTRIRHDIPAGVACSRAAAS